MIDRLSQLPDNILEIILSLMPTKDIVRSSILSKTWYRVCTSFPIRDFSEIDFGISTKIKDREELNRKLKNFENFVDGCLSKQTHVRTFCLYKDFWFDKVQNNPVINKWIKLANSKNLENLDLQIDVPEHYYGTYHLPENIFDSLSLMVFRCRNCILKLPFSDFPIKWPSLRIFSLRDCWVDREIIRNLSVISPLIEELELNKCVVVNKAPPINLQIIDNRIPKGKGICSVFPLLKVLVLNECRLPDQPLKISSVCLEKLELVRGWMPSVIIEAPNLHSFKFSTNKIPAVFSLDCVSCISNIELWDDEDCHDLREFLAKFSHIELLTFNIYLPVERTCSFENLEAAFVPPLTNVKCMKLQNEGLMSSHRHSPQEEVTHCLLWVCQPESLTWIASRHFENMYFIRLLYEKIMTMHKNYLKTLDCYSNQKIECGQQYLKDFEIQGLPGITNTRAWEYCNLSPYFCRLKSKDEIKFMFKW